MKRWLLVRAGGTAVALPAVAVDRVLEVPEPQPVPGGRAGIRGVAPLGGKLAPVVCLDAILSTGTAPAGPSGVGVALLLGDRRVILEVDEVADLAALGDEPLPDAWRGGWAAAAVRHAGALVPVLDVAWLAAVLDEGAQTTA